MCSFSKYNLQNSSRWKCWQNGGGKNLEILLPYNLATEARWMNLEWYVYNNSTEMLTPRKNIIQNYIRVDVLDVIVTKK